MITRRNFMQLKRRLQRNTPNKKHVAFVCIHGCHSAKASKKFRAYLDQRNLSGRVKVSSTGTILDEFTDPKKIPDVIVSPIFDERLRNRPSYQGAYRKINQQMPGAKQIPLSRYSTTHNIKLFKRILSELELQKD
jgi:hypothetical protein